MSCNSREAYIENIFFGRDVSFIIKQYWSPNDDCLICEEFESIVKFNLLKSTYIMLRFDHVPHYEKIDIHVKDDTVNFTMYSKRGEGSYTCHNACGINNFISQLLHNQSLEYFKDDNSSPLRRIHSMHCPYMTWTITAGLFAIKQEYLRRRLFEILTTGKVPRELEYEREIYDAYTSIESDHTFAKSFGILEKNTWHRKYSNVCRGVGGTTYTLVEKNT